MTNREPPGFMAVTAGKVLLGGALAMSVSGKRIVSENGIQDPSARVATTLRDALARERKLEIVSIDGTMGPGGAASAIADRYPGVDYLVDVETSSWGFTYFPTSWGRYRVMYTAKLRLIDTRQRREIAQTSCTRAWPDSAAQAPSRDELLADGAARLKRELDSAGETCARELATSLQLSVAPEAWAGDPAAAAAAQPAPFPALPEPNCTRNALVPAGAYAAENNAWGDAGATPNGTQCVAIAAADAPQAVDAELSWSWPIPRGGRFLLRGYPEIVFGHKPWLSRLEGPLPTRVDGFSRAVVRGSYTRSHDPELEAMSMLDVYFTRSTTKDGDHLPIAVQFQVWLETFGPQTPQGKRIASDVDIGGTRWDVYFTREADSQSDGRAYAAYQARHGGPGPFSLDLRAFVDDLNRRVQGGAVPGDLYLASIEFGTIVSRGKGTTRVAGYRVDVAP